MPYSNPKQATAIFLSIKRKKGEAAAEAFGRKHREDFGHARKRRGYKSRSKRNA